MTTAGDRSDDERLRAIPTLRARRQHERQPVRGNCCVKESHTEAGNGYRGQDGVVHVLPFTPWFWAWPEPLLEWSMSIGKGNNKSKVVKAPSELLAKRIKRGERLRPYLQPHGLWLSLVERLVRDQEAVGSNPTSPTTFLMEAMFHVYVLRSAMTGRRYVGSCQDLGDRLRRHNAGESSATKHGVPSELVYSESVPTRSEALRHERYYKTGRGRDELDRLALAR